jgi:predicted alpha/beta hydrolase
MNPLILFPCLLFGGLLARLIVPRDNFALGFGVGFGAALAFLVEQKEAWWAWLVVVIGFVILIGWRRRKIARETTNN